MRNISQKTSALADPAGISGRNSDMTRCLLGFVQARLGWHLLLEDCPFFKSRAKSLHQNRIFGLIPSRVCKLVINLLLNKFCFDKIVCSKTWPDLRWTGNGVLISII